MGILKYGIAALCVISVAYFDLRERRAPDVLTLGGLLVMLPLSLSEGKAAIMLALLGAGIAAGVLFFARISTRGGLGWGDIKFGAFLGAFLGPRLLLLGFFASALFALSYFGYWHLRKKLRGDERVPFTPFLGAGAVAASVIAAAFPGSWV